MFTPATAGDRVTDIQGADGRVADALKAARLYYFHELTMETIARELNTSRSTVSRLIGFARRSGLVEIRITSPWERAPQLERTLSRTFAVTAHVVPVPDTASELERLDRVAMFAARLLNGLFDSDRVLGVAWGTTVSAVSRHLVAKRTHNAAVVQLNGAANTHTTGIAYASDIIRRFGSAYSARVQEFPVPAFFDYAETKQALWRERSVRRILDLQAAMDVALFSIGTLDAAVPSHVYSAGYLEESDFADLRADGVVGDVATVFFRGDGSDTGIALNARASGPGLDRLRGVRHRLCVVAGEQKVVGVLGALRGGLVSDLVLDEGAATALLAAAA